MTQGPNVSLGPTKSPSCRSLFRQSKIRRWRSAIAHFHDWHLSHENTRICNSRHDTSTGRRSRGWRSTRSLADPSTPEITSPAAMRQRGRPTSRPISSATRADFGQTIKPYVILLDSLGQSVSIGIGLVKIRPGLLVLVGDG